MPYSSLNQPGIYAEVLDHLATLSIYLLVQDRLKDVLQFSSQFIQENTRTKCRVTLNQT